MSINQKDTHTKPKDMKNQTNFRSQAFKRAWAIVKESSVSFSEALQMAWKAYRLTRRMLTDKVEFAFRKMNGEIRKAIGTLNIEFERKSDSEQFKSVVYFDVEKQAFRSFKPQNLVS